nr:cytochrome b5 domain-containing protein [Actinomycetes bacterium]
IAKESGAALEQTRGVTDEHHDWGNRTFYLAIALTVVSALWLWLDTKPKSKTKLATGIIVVLVSLAAITSTVLAGDSGAKAVWETRASESDVEPTVYSQESGAQDTGIPLSEVALHSSVDDCWSAVDGNVYDLTKWISEHPGGNGPIESMCGVDSTEAFTGQHGGQNKPERELGKYKVGVLG